MKRFFLKKLNFLLVFILLITQFFNWGSFYQLEAAEPATELFISEYVEGSGSNKIIEIYNGTGGTVDLSDYAILGYQNGNTTIGYTLDLEGLLPSGDVFVIAHPSAVVSDDVVDLRYGLQHNGNDVVALYKAGQLIDVLGTIGDASDFAKDVTLVRNDSVTAGSTTYQENEWTSYAKDTFDYIGDHGESTGGTPIEEPADSISIAEARVTTSGAVTIEGVATVDSGKWGSKGFYVQDETGGIYVYQGSTDITQGDRLEIEGDIGSYNGELQIQGAVSITNKGTDTVPTPQLVEIEEVTDAVAGQLLRLENVTITNLVQINSYGTLEFIAEQEGNSLLIRIDNRTGMTYDDFIASYSEGDVLHVEGILGEYNGTLQLKPRGSEDIEAGEVVGGLRIQGHTPVATAQQNTTVEIAATIKGTPPISAKVYYKEAGSTDAYNSIEMTVSEGDSYVANLPIETENMAYYIEATDGMTTVTNPQDLSEPNIIQVFDVMTLAEAKSFQDGTEVVVKGFVTSVYANGDGKDAIQDALVDPTEGIQLYYQENKEISYEVGDEVKISGIMGTYGGVRQITNFTVEVLSTDQSIQPTVVTVDDLLNNAEVYIGQLIKLEDMTLEAPSGNYLPLTDGNEKTINIYSPPALEDVSTGDQVDVVAIGSAYYGSAQLHVRTSIDIRPAGTMTIEEAKAQVDGTEVTVIGIVTSDYVTGNGKDFIQDATSGINVYLAGGAGFSLGDKVKVTGEKTEYNGLNEILLSEYEVLAEDDSIDPQVVTIDGINEALEGSLILLEKVTIGEEEGNTVPVEDELEHKINIYNGPDLSKYVGLTVDLVAIVSEYNGTYQLHVRSGEDLLLPLPVISNQSPMNVTLDAIDTRPEISAAYTSVIGIDTSNIQLFMNDVDVTSEAVITESAMTYVPTEALSLGSHTVKLIVGDSLGQVISSTWNFAIGEEAYYHYRGQIHAHTEYSDGKGTAREAFAQARDEGEADFFAITDHSNWFDNDADPDNATLTDVTDSSSQTWVGMHEDADAYNAPGEFVAMAGYEMTWSGSTGGWGHINTFNTPWFMTRSTYSGNVEDYGNSINLEEYYDYIADDADSIHQLNHPGKTFGDFADFGYYNVRTDDVVNLIEVGNGEGPIRGSGYWPSYEYYTRALDKGWHVAPTNNQDNHKGNFIISNEARTVALATSLTREDIYEAFSERRVYASEDRNIEVNYSVNGELMGSILTDEPETLTFEIEVTDPDIRDTIKTVQIISDGGIIAAEKTFNTNEVTWDFTLDTKYSYYYVRIDQTDKDIVVTAPIWTGSVSPYGFNELTASKDIVEIGDSVDLAATVYNNGSELLNQATVTFYENEIVEKNIIGTDQVSNIGGGATDEAYLSYTPSSTGSYTLYAVMTLNVEGSEKTYIASTTFEVMSSDQLIKVLVDHGHNNHYVSGSYEGRDTAFMEMLKEKKMMVIEQEEPITEESLEGVQILVITSPQPANDTGSYPVDRSKLSQDEIDAISQYMAQGGHLIITSRADYSDHEEYADHDESYESAEQANRLLEAIGANLRVNDDQITDFDQNDGMEYKLLLDQYTGTKFNLVNDPNLQGEEPLPYRIFSGSSVLLKEGGDDTHVDFLVKGHSTTFSNDVDGSNVGGDGDNVSVAQGQVYALAAEELSSGGKVIVAGSTFFSDFEIQDDNVMANTQITSNILNWMKADLTTIEAVRQDADNDGIPDNLGKYFTIEGRVTSMSESYSKENGLNNAFFEVIYVQDETGGITVFGVSTTSLQLGQKVKVTGYVDAYQNDTELAIDNEQEDLFVYEGDIVPLLPTEVTTAKSMEEVTEGSLVKVQGEVVRMDTQNLYLDDGSGEARIYVEGYIGNNVGEALGKWDEAIGIGDVVSAIGLASEDSEGHRLRVRNTSEIVKVSSAPEEDNDKDDDDDDKSNKESDSLIANGKDIYEVIETIETTIPSINNSASAEQLTEDLLETLARGADELGIIEETEKQIELSNKLCKMVTSYIKVLMEIEDKTVVIQTVQDTLEELDQIVSYGSTSHIEQLAYQKTVLDLVNVGLEVVGTFEINREDIENIKGDTTILLEESITEEEIEELVNQILVLKDKAENLIGDERSNEIVGSLTFEVLEFNATEDKYSIELPTDIMERIGVDEIQVIQFKVGSLTFSFQKKTLMEALGETVTLTIEELEELEGQIPEGVASIEGMPIFDITLLSDEDEFTLEEPMMMSFNLSQWEGALLSTMELDQLVFYLFDEVEEAWVPVGGFYNPITERIEVYREHFSDYTLMYSNKTFTHALSSWAQEGILALFNKGIIEDLDNFESKEEITREEFTVWLTKAFGLVHKNNELPFEDVSLEHPHYKEINAAYEAGLIYGRSETLFDPKATIRRDEIVTILTRAMIRYKGIHTPLNVESELNGFKDRDLIPTWAREGIATMRRYGFVSGYPDGNYGPDAAITKEETAALLYRLLTY